jgi:hypothetical protein
MSDERAHLASAIRAIDESRRAYIEQLEDHEVEERSERFEHEPVIQLAHLQMEREELLAQMLRELRTIWREHARKSPEESRQWRTRLVTQWHDWPADDTLVRAQLQLASDPAMDELVVTALIGEEPLELWRTTRAQMHGRNWPRKIDAQITEWGRQLVAGEVPEALL